MPHKYLLLLSLFVSSLVYGQNKTGTVKGAIKDSASKVALELATVSLFDKDSVLLNYKLTDKDGKFEMAEVPLGQPILLSIAASGYKNVFKEVTFDSSHLTLDYFLPSDFGDENEVVVKSIAPVRMNGDTLEINPAAFKNIDKNGVAEDVLNQVPGLVIWSDGTMTLNGREIKNKLVDGQQFMGSSDARVATQNISKDAIDKIQIYEEVDRSQIAQSSSTKQPKDSVLTLNIKLKEDSKMGYFGKLSAGIGTRDRYESDLSFQMYNKKSSFGIGGGINNINKDIGNLQSIFLNNTYRNSNPNLENVGNFNNQGISKNHSIGAVYQHNFLETANSRQQDALTVNYVKSGSDQTISSQSYEQRTALDNPLFITGNEENKNHNNKHEIGLNYRKNRSYWDNLQLTGNAAFENSNNQSTSNSTTRDSAGNIQSTNDTRNYTTSRSNNQSLSGNYYNFDFQNPLTSIYYNFDLSHSDNHSERRAQNDFRSLADPSQDTAYNRLYITDTRSFSVSPNIRYNGIKRLLFRRFNLWDIDMSMLQNFAFNKNINNSKVYDWDSTSGSFVANNTLTNDNTNNVYKYTPGLQFNKSWDNWGETGYRYIFTSASVSDQWIKDNNISSLDYRNLNRNFNFLNYSLSINYSKMKRNVYRLYSYVSYNKSNSYASIDQLHPVIDLINPYSITYGNPNLKNSTAHNFNFYINFSTQKPKSKYGFNGNINSQYGITKNPTVDSLINESVNDVLTGRRFTYYTNVSQKDNFNTSYNFRLARKFKNNTLSLFWNGSYSLTHSPTYIDNIYSKTNMTNYSNTVNLEYNLHDKLILAGSKSLNIYKSKQTAAGLSSYKNTQDNYRFRAVYNYLPDASISSTYTITKNSNLDKPVNLLNAFASYRFTQGKQLEIKFSAMDILRQFKNISNSATSYGTISTVTNGLQQYFVFTLSFYPRKFGKSFLKVQEEKNKDNNDVIYYSN